MTDKSLEEKVADLERQVKILKLQKANLRHQVDAARSLKKYISNTSTSNIHTPTIEKFLEPIS